MNVLGEKDLPATTVGLTKKSEKWHDLTFNQAPFLFPLMFSLGRSLK